MKQLLDILFEITKPIKDKYIERTKERAKMSFESFVEKSKWSEQQWLDSFKIKYSWIDPPGYMTNREKIISIDSSEYHKKTLYKMRDKRRQILSIIHKGYNKFEENQIKLAERHYEDATRKLNYRLTEKGLDQNNLQVISAWVGVNFEIILTDGVKEVRAWTIIAEGPVQMAHYRYLIK